MPISFTSRATLKDWHALHEVHERVLLAHAQTCGALRLCLYRNAHDATQVLLIAEFAEVDGLREFLGTWFEVSAPLWSGVANDALWEPIGWTVIP